MSAPTLDIVQLNNHGNPWPFNDPATEKKDCNVAKAAEAVSYFNGTQLTSEQTRQMGGAPGNVPTGNALARRVFEAQGMVNGQNFILANPRPFTDLKSVLYAGWYVGLYIDYGVLHDQGGVSGDRNYRGLHCVGVWGWRRSPQGLLVWDHDPLFDGRRPAIPFGRQHVPLAPLRLAAEAGVVAQKLAADGSGLWSGWAVKIPL